MDKNDEKEYIVFVDDEPQVLRALVRDVFPWAREVDVEIDVVESGLECIDLLNERNGVVSLIVTDLRMPFIQGGELMIEIRKRYPDVGLVLLTAYSDADEMQKAVSAEMACYVPKPWDVEPFVAQLNHTLELVRARRRNARYQEQINQQLRMAGDFQRSFLAMAPPNTDRVSFDITYQPLSKMYCGGDYYDVIEIDSSHLLLLVGDVSGHGVSSALITAKIKILTQDLAILSDSKPSASAFLNSLNSALCERLPEQSTVLVTFAAAIIDIENMSISVSNAGHLPVYRIRDDECLALSVDGQAMGYDPSVRYHEKQHDLEVDDKVTVFTNGLVASGHDGSSVDAVDIADILLQSKKSTGFNQSVLELFRAAHGTDTYYDDVTILTAEIG
jgi:phosphoserine phosphatase RsbU/P